jgi:hypothetical protein
VTDSPLAVDLAGALASCPAASGLYFADNTVIPLFRQSSALAMETRRPLAQRELIDCGATTLHIAWETVAGDHVLVGGGGAWEGEGFLAALSAGTVNWLLYLEDCEEFRSAHVDQGIVTAVAEEYPLKHTVRVPLLDPEWVQVSSEHS